ncbi:hypothetical protein COV49_02595 [Candidatus Falkowbacteria bacterium CG11_big_fil_rev_8_21_14_0_20_39_10]|uniref:Fibronectin type-III domain-containing protein n=1 Tax=Candidatus Falkowbacteria bacterium CG11_big_fil_rev_8_21_14_0_20_39_10 TaxID=1974570 RepID=A0A2M6K8S0_9BACT|nr:MAG: hypothetical protein COV49_02595 [Candidatus Falkowbacteria bacterium CG11_big_fil_rev_8_21_14_0_20_39_10]
MFKHNKKIIFWLAGPLVLMLATLLGANFVLAQDLDVGLTPVEATGLGSEDPRLIVANIVRIILGFLGVVALGLIMYAGWLWMTAEGNAERQETAKKILTGAIIGLVIILSSFAIATFILNKILQVTDSGGTGPGGGPPGGGPPGGGPGDSYVSCDANPLTPVCDKDNNACSEDEYCNDDCHCRSLSGYGQSCDVSEDIDGCQAETGRCQEYLECRADQDCTCQGGPVIEDISPKDELNNPNGASGNLITISGRYFSDTVGEVYFWDGSDYTLKAGFPDELNPNCDSNWQDRQIIVVVPAGAESGPIKVVRADGAADTTEDSRGSAINDFIVNGISRPGLCLASPNSGFFGDSFTLEGVAFSGNNKKVLFGSQISSTTADNISGWTNTSVEAAAPNISKGKNTVFVNISGNSSNYLNFEILYNLNNQPVIKYIDPPQGPAGQYITIYGQNFQTYKSGASKVELYPEADPDNLIYADTDFPSACQGRWWHDNYITVKAPTADSGIYKVIITNRDANTSAGVDFTITVGSPGPGICLLDPHNGPVGQSVDIYGDNFKTSQANGQAVFYNNTEAMIDGWADQAISGRVPSGAQTGPFKVINAESLVSNNLPFTVGSCSADDQCEAGEECCASGTHWSGICRLAGTCSQGGFSACAFGWTFSTAVGPALTCGGYSNVNACLDSGFCPNSPGQCQTESGQALGECGDDYCNSNFTDCVGSCIYDSNLNKCKLDNFTCDQINPLLIDGYTAECRLVGGEGIWQINTKGASCPAGAYLDTNNWCTVGAIGSPQSCSLCPDDFDCQIGECVKDKAVCPRDSSCLDNKCILNNSNCQCCCRVGYDSQDCCAGLTCAAGNCGAGAPLWGLCTGCRVELDGNSSTVTAEEQTDSNQACDCSKSKSRYCRIINNDPVYGNGACEDAALPNEPCYDAATAATCNPDEPLCLEGYFCDPDESCTCQELAGLDEPCYDADTAATCDSSQPACQEGYFCDPEEACTCQAEGTGPGLSCYNEELQSCGFSCSPGYGCLGQSGCAQTACGEDSTCLCCCDPDNDQCGDIDSGDPSVSLVCHADIFPCTAETNERGLCCGCSEDSHCGNAEAVGCSADSCCRQRPAVTEVFPADSSLNVCRNTMVSASFDQKMDLSAFSGNIVALADYEDSACPEGLPYFSLNNSVRRYSWFKKIINKTVRTLNNILEPILGKRVLADDNNYCAITGRVSAEQNGDETTTVYFSPDKALDADRNYYVIIKGDESLNSQAGVLSFWGVGMNGPDEEIFNGVGFDNAKIWTFKTLASQGSGSGLCQVDYVNVSPGSYLFQTADNDLAEDDSNYSSKTFDSAADGDKLFAAGAYGADNQMLVGVPGYNWDWSWTIDNSGVADFVDVSNLESRKKLIRAQNTVTDGQTQARATLTITEDDFSAVSTVGSQKIGSAFVWVFLCANPWPPVKNGIWSPWQDSIQGMNCLGGTGECKDVNYQLYYCRDVGDGSTADDLPAILSDNTIIRGFSAEQNVLKESYFFREDLPDISGIGLSVIAVPSDGAKVTLSWNPIFVPAGEELAGYKIYYGLQSGQYSGSLQVGDVTSYTVNNLTNNQPYYFSITARFKSGAESPYSNEVTAAPADIAGPVQPSIDDSGIIAGDSQISIPWSDSSAGDAIGFRIFYKASESCDSNTGFGNSIPASVSPTVIPNLNNDTAYCFGLIGYDRYGNASATSTAAATPTGE